MHSIRACLGGSGLGAFSHPFTIEQMVALVGPPKTGKLQVAYLGTAAYDLPEPEETQTALLRQQWGGTVRPIRVADPQVKKVTGEDADFIKSVADIILVSGGNTLYAIRRWEETGIADLLKDAAVAQRAVLAGGSAGAICWFTSGHSDSADPATYVQPSLQRAALKAGLVAKEDREKTEAELAALSTSWSYIRVHGLNVLPGLLGPHFDVTQGNGVRREEDLTAMVKRHPTERGIGLDHWALLLLKGDGRYEVVSPPGKTRTVVAGDADPEATVPGIFTIDVVDGTVRRRRMPREGPLDDLLRAPTGPTVADPFERFHAMENPTASSGSLVRR